MNMYPQKNKEIATRLDNLYETSISSVLVPAVTKYGIVVGNYLVKPHDGFFQIMKRKEIFKFFFTELFDYMFNKIFILMFGI